MYCANVKKLGVVKISRLRQKTTATLLIVAFMISMFSVAIPINAVVESVVIHSPPPTYLGGIVEILVDVNATDEMYEVTITVTDPSGGRSSFISFRIGSGMVTVLYPTHFSQNPDMPTTMLPGWYKIAAFGRTGGFQVLEPELTLYPDSGISTFWVYGDHFTPGTDVTLTWDGDPLFGGLPVEISVGEDGTFGGIAVVPTQSDPGEHTVVATDSEV